MSLFFNVIFCLFVIILLNRWIKNIQPDWMLTQSELLTIYILLCMGSVVASHDFGQILVPLIGHVSWFETPENEWRDLFFRYMPTWLTIQDKSILEGYYEGESTLYSLARFKAWMPPMLWWTTFIVALLFVMVLAYPIIELPFAMTQSSGTQFFSNRLFWIAFVLVAILNVVNGLSYFIPSIPSHWRSISKYWLFIY